MPSDIRCTTCQKLFKTKPALKAHEKRLHGENILYFVCPGCNKTIRYIKNFAKHYMFAHKTSAKEAKAVEKTLVPNYANSINDIPGKSHLYIQMLSADTCHLQTYFSFQCLLNVQNKTLLVNFYTLTKNL